MFFYWFLSLGPVHAHRKWEANSGHRLIPCYTYISAYIVAPCFCCLQTMSIRTTLKILIIVFLWFGRIEKMNTIAYFTGTLQPFSFKLKKRPQVGVFIIVQFLNEECSEQGHFSSRAWHSQKQLDCFIAQPLWFTKK